MDVVDGCTVVSPQAAYRHRERFGQAIKDRAVEART